MKNMKKSLRASMLAIRDSLSLEERCRKSTLIARKLFDLEEFQRASSILFYVAARSEVQTEGMIREAIKQGKRVLVPVTDTKNKRLFISELHDFDAELAKGAYGILEPAENYRRFVPLSEVKMIIVPGAAFDLQGYRIGYGGGYYDRMLAEEAEDRRLKADICLVGVCFDCQIINAIPIEEHDMAVGMIITEERMVVSVCGT